MVYVIPNYWVFILFLEGKLIDNEWSIFFVTNLIFFLFYFSYFVAIFRWLYEGAHMTFPCAILFYPIPIPSSCSIIPPCSGKNQPAPPPSFPSSLNSVITSCPPHFRPSLSSSSAAWIVRPCLPKLLSIAIAAVDVLLPSPAEASKERRGIKQPLAPPSRRSCCCSVLHRGLLHLHLPKELQVIKSSQLFPCSGHLVKRLKRKSEHQTAISASMYRPPLSPAFFLL